MRLETSLVCTSAYATPESFAHFSKHLDAEWIEQALQATGSASLRRRRLPAEQVVWLVLGMALMRDRPIGEVVRQLELALPDKSSRSVAPSSIPAARARLGAEAMEWLFMRSGSEWAHASADRNRWRGLALYGVDGTTLHVPDSDENRQHFGGHPGHRGESGYPMVCLTALMALRSHLLAAASFGPYGVSERTYAADLWPSVPDNSLTVMDRGLVQASVLIRLSQGGANRHWLSRAKSSNKWTVCRKVGPGDFVVEMKVSSEARRKDPTLPKVMLARVIEYRIGKHAPQKLLTSLLDEKAYPAKELVALYHERWELEVGYDEIKTTLLDRQEAIRSKGKEGVHQELWGILLLYNLVRLEMQAIADEVQLPPLRISFVAALRFIREEWTWSALTTSPGAIPKHLSDLRDKIRQFVLPPRRTERVYPRAVKVKMSNYDRNRRPAN